MKDIIVNTRWGKKHCRFHSVEEMVVYHLDNGKEYNVKSALEDVVQCNVAYRNFLRNNGYPATKNKLKSEAPSLALIPDAFDVIDKWWGKVEEKGGLGDYDIQCYELTDSFILLGEKFNGLESIQNIVNASESNRNNNCLDAKWNKYNKMDERERYPDNRKNRQSSLYAAELWEKYPCFDSSDSLYENRYYRCYYIRNHKINEEFFKFSRKENLLNIIREDIDDLSNLPIIYYDGESPVMYVMGQRMIDAEGFVKSQAFEMAMRQAFTDKDIYSRKSDITRCLVKCTQEFLRILKPQLYSVVSDTKPMLDAGAVFNELEKELMALPECAVRKWCGPIRIFTRREWIQQAEEWLCEQIMWKTESILSNAENLPEILGKWSLCRGFEFVNDVHSRYNGTFEEKRNSWPTSAITCAAHADWHSWFSIVENAREWLVSPENRFGVKTFEINLRNPMMVDVAELELRWDENKLSITVIAKNLSSWRQCRKGIFFGSLEDAVKLMFSKDIIPVLIYEGLRDD